MKVGVKLSIPLNNLSKTREERSGEKERKKDKEGNEEGSMKERKNKEQKEKRKGNMRLKLESFNLL